MNERIKELAEQIYGSAHHDDFKFAESIVKEHIDLLRQEWYDLNNAKTPDNETLRDIGYRVGRKAEVIALMDKVKKHFGTE